MEDLFSQLAKSKAPLADRMRPRTLDEFIGQKHVVGPGRLLRRAIEADSLTSSIFFGPPGCGKTTLLRMAAGFETPDTGRILLAGKDITHLPANQRPVNTVFQNYALFPHLSVRDNVGFGPRIAGVAASQRTADVNEMLRLVKLEAHADKKPAQLSGGQKQRVAIARSLIMDPAILLADEPTGNLDSQTGETILDLLTEVAHADRRRLVVMVTHDDHAASIADTKITVTDGKIA